MSKIFLFFLSLFVVSIAFAQDQAEVITDTDGSKILKGLISKESLTSDSSFAWFDKESKDYTPYAAAVKTLQTNKDKIDFVVFMGTWCHDSQFIVPKFYRLLEAAGYPEDKVSMIGVDRSKKTLNHLAETFHIINVPTIMVLKDGVEIGRVVEYGKYGMFDKEIGEIIAAAK